MFESIFDCAFVAGRSGVLKEGLSIRFVLAKFAFKVGSIDVVDLSISLFHSISEST